MMIENFACSFDDIIAAQQRISAATVLTPIIESPFLNQQLQAKVFFKAENLQKTGSFKFRGAYHFLKLLCEKGTPQGVVTYSSGNHAQAVAAAAALMKLPAVIVMPKDAPCIKIQHTQRYNPEIVFYDRQTQSREQLALEIAKERDWVIVPPYDHPYIMAGQGTVGLEMTQQLRAMNERLNIVLCPCSGGGLMAGCALAIKELFPETQIFSVEPEKYADTAKSLQAGKRLSIQPEQNTICDALMQPEPGEMTFPILLSTLSGGLTVTENEVKQAVLFAFEHLKLVVEPGGAVALSALLSGRIDCQNKTVGVILSGGNVDIQRFINCLELSTLFAP